MRRLCSRYAYSFNMQHGRSGHLFQERFKSEPIDSDAYLLTAVRYIHANPEKAGLAAMGAYPWSSYREYAGGNCRVPPICTREFVLDCFGGLRGFLSFHETMGSEPALADVGAARTQTTAMPDQDAIAIADDALLGARLSDLKTMPKDERDTALRDLLDAGLSVRQIVRLTGIGRGIVQRARR